MSDEPRTVSEEDYARITDAWNAVQLAQAKFALVNAEINQQYQVGPTEVIWGDRTIRPNPNGAPPT